MKSSIAKKLLREAKAESPPIGLLHRYECYLSCADDGDGFECVDSDRPDDPANALKTFDQWLGPI